MNLFLGFSPEDESKKKISEITNGVKDVFDDFDIKVRWSNPKTYHMTLLFLTNNATIINIFMNKQKLKKFVFKKFKIRLNSVKLGVSRKYRELLYLDVLEGGDDMRKLYLELRKITGAKEDMNFLPHLTLGRVNKDLTTQEYMNIVKDLTVVTKQLKVSEIEFEVGNIDLVKSENGLYTVEVSFRGL